jgi:hypothetical protein
MALLHSAKALGAFILVGVAMLALCGYASGADDQVCNPSGAAAVHGQPVNPPVTLESTGPADPINMGGLRGVGTTDIAVTATPALPPSVTPDQITLEIPKRPERSGATLNTAYLPSPTFSRPRILEEGKIIAFTMCLDASHTGAGSYVGQVIIGGPEGVQPTTVAVTLNAKNHTAYLIGLILAAVAALVLLFLRGVKLGYDTLTEGSNAQRVRTAAGNTLKDPFGFWVPTVIGIGAAVFAMAQVYDSNVSWGADTVSSLIALGGTAISAAGLGTFLSSLKGS